MIRTQLTCLLFMVGLLVPISSARALHLCAKADLRGPDPTAPKNNSPIKLREQCKSPKEVSIGTTADLAEIQANKAAIAAKADRSEVDANTSAIAGKADQSAVDANTSAIGANATAIAEKADQSAVEGVAADVARNAGDIALLFDSCSAVNGSPEWGVNGDGTTTQCSTGLVWEMKTRMHDDGVECADATACPNPHEVENRYTWSGPSYGTSNEKDGTAFTVFLAQLNSPPCFAGHCDWRLPTIEELSGRSNCDGGSTCEAAGGIVDFSEGFCTGATGACTTMPGQSQNNFYWSLSSFETNVGDAWGLYSDQGTISNVSKLWYYPVRAVRDPS